MNDCNQAAGWRWWGVIVLAMAGPAALAAAETAPQDTAVSIVDKITRDMTTLAQELNAKQQSIEVLQQQYDALQRSNGEMLEQLAQKDRRLQEKDAAYEELQAQLQAQRSQVSQLQVEITGLAHQQQQDAVLRAGQEKTIAGLQQAVTRAQEALQAEQDARQADQQRAKQQADEAAALAQRLSGEFEARGDQVRMLEEALKTIQADHDAAAAARELHGQEWAQEKDRLLIMVKGYEEELRVADSARRQLQEQLNRERQNAADQAARQDQEKIELLRQRDAQLAQAQEKQAELTRDYKRLLAEKDVQHAQAQSDMRRLEETMATRSLDREKALQEELAGVRRETARRLQDLGDRLSEQVRLSAGSAKEYEEQLRKKDDQLASLRAALEQREKLFLEISGDTQKQKIEQQLAALRKENETLSANNSRLVEDKLQLMARMIKVSDTDGAANPEEVRFVRDELANMSAALTRANTQYAELKNNYDSLLQEKIQTYGGVEQLKEALAQREQDIQLLSEQLRRQESDYSGRLETNQKQLSEQLKEFRDLAQELEKKNALVNEEKQLYLAQLEELKKRGADFEQKFNASEEERRQLAQRLKEFYKTERGWQKKDNEQVQLLTKYADKVESLSKEITEIMAGKKEVELQLAALPQRVARLENESEQLRKQNSTLHYNLGVFHTQRQEYTQAVDHFQQALKFNPHDYSAHYNLGIVYSRYLIDEAKAVSHFKHYLSLAPPADKDAQRAREYVVLWGAKDGVR